MFKSMLIANRGEIARRIIRTAKRLGIETIAIYSDIDETALFVQEADKTIRASGAKPKGSVEETKIWIGNQRAEEVVPSTATAILALMELGL